MAWLVFLSLISIALALLSGRRFDGEKVFRVTVQTEKDINIIQNLAIIVPITKNCTLQLDFWRPDSVRHIALEMDVDFRITADHCGYVQKVLEENHIQYKILFHNLQQGVENQFARKRSFSRELHSYTRFNNWKTIVSWMDQLEKKYPQLVSRVSIGTTAQGQPMYLLKVGKNTEKNAIFIDCGIHAREWISPAFCQWFVKEATSGKDKTMNRLLKNMSFYVLPVLNIDGYIYTWTKNRFWRKNRSKYPGIRCVGTDLNRNFDSAWGTIGSSNYSCSKIYGGCGPESEKETKAVANFIRAHVDSIKAYLSFHSYSQMLLFPYSYKYDLAPNHEELNAVAKDAVEALSSLYGTNFTYGPSASTIYPTSGSSDDWAYEQGIKYSYTFELRDIGEYGFLLPEYLIQPTCMETMLAVKSIASHVLKNAT